MSDILSNFMLLSSFMSWIKEALPFMPRSVMYTVMWVYILFYVATYPHVVFSNFGLLGFKREGDKVWYRFFWIFLLTTVHSSAIAYWVWRRARLRAENNRTKDELGISAERAKELTEERNKLRRKLLMVFSASFAGAFLLFLYSVILLI